jgi:hypothetical protein
MRSFDSHIKSRKDFICMCHSACCNRKLSQSVRAIDEKHSEVVEFGRLEEKARLPWLNPHLHKKGFAPIIIFSMCLEMRHTHRFGVERATIW